MVSFFDEILSQAPKQLRTILWFFCLALGIGFLGMRIGQSEEKTAANVAEVADRVVKLEDGQSQLWRTINEKLDKINSQVAQTSQDIAVLNEHVKNSERHK